MAYSHNKSTFLCQERIIWGTLAHHRRLVRETNERLATKSTEDDDLHLHYADLSVEVASAQERTTP